MKIYELLKKLRMEKGFTQKQMAKELHVETNTYCQYENGKRQIGVDTFLKILSILNIHISIEKLLESYVKTNSNGMDNAFDTYLKDIEQYPQLSEKELLSLFQLMPNDEIKKKIAQSCLHYVVNIILEMKINEMHIMDMILEGNIGLMKSIDDFNSDNHASFIFYMEGRVRDSISRAVLEQQHMRIESMKRNFAYFTPPQFKIKKYIKQLTEELGREPTMMELSERTGIEFEKIKEIFRILKEPISMEVEENSNHDKKNK